MIKKTALTDLFVICGLHRSGTTYAGEILRHAGATVVHEPLNERFGVRGVPIAYPYVENESDTFVELLDDVLNFSRPWSKDLTYIKATGLKRYIYAMTGGRSGLRWGRLRISHNLGISNGKVCLKDPFMSLATPYIIRKYGLQVVCLVRHPAAIHYSTEKQKWRFDVENLVKQTALVERYGADIPKEHWMLAKEHPAASIALLWKFMIRINTNESRKNKRILLVRHEDLCLEPQNTAANICDHLGVEFSNKVQNFVSEHSEGGGVDAADGKTHDFKRNSRGIVDVWRNRINKEDELLMRALVLSDVISFYGKW